MKEAKMTNSSPEYKDFMGIPINEGDLVVFYSGSGIRLSSGTVVGFTPMKIRIRLTGSTSGTCTKFPTQIASIQSNKSVYPEFFL